MSTVQPKSGKNHKLFGSAFYKVHQMKDPKWNANDKIAQYSCMASVHRKHHDLERVKQQTEYNSQLEKYKEQAAAVKVLRLNLKSLQYGDVQGIKNIFQNHREQQLVYPYLPLERIMNHMDDKLFDKRKALDRLMYEKHKLSKTYAEKLLKLGNIQDRFKHQDNVELKDELLAKRLRVELKNSEIRIKAFDCMNKDCIKFIDTLAKDSIYYTTILDTLRDDVLEQADIINTTIRLGLPALINLDNYKNQFSSLERQFEMDARNRTTTLLAFKEKLTENERKLRSLIRKDDDFDLIPNCYNRETASMLDLQKEFKNVEIDMKSLCAVTACEHPQNVVASYQKAFTDEENIKKTLDGLETMLNELNDKIAASEQIEDSLIHNYSNEDADRETEIEKLKEKIQLEEKRRAEIENRIQERQQQRFVLQHSLQHFANLLRNVGSSPEKVQKMYPSSVLELPLLELHFGVFDEKSEPPETIEEDIDKLFEMVTSRVRLLMDNYNVAEAIDESTDRCERVYHDKILEELKFNEIEGTKETVDSYFETDFDPSVAQRDDIKLLSRKIVEENTKEDD